MGENAPESAETLYEHICDCIHSAAREALGERGKRKKGGRKYIWSEEIEAAVRRKKSSYLTALSKKKPEDWEKYKNDRRNVKRLVAHESNQVWDQKCAEIDTYIGGRRCSEVWKFLRSVKTEYKDRAPVEIISIGEWNTYYKKLLAEDRTSFITNEIITKETTIEDKSITVTTGEVETAVKKLKIVKAAGPGNIPAELLKNAPQKLYKMIAQLFTICANEHTRIIPKEWKIAHITPIFKHGDRKNCDNYRAISVTSTFSRLFGRIVRDLIETEYIDKEAEEQAGFRAGRSCNDNDFVLKQLIEKQLSIGKEVHLLFIDLEKAYDNIPLIKLWKALQETGISSTLTKTVKELYRRSLSYIKHGGLLSEGFEVTKGLRQGCCISPTLFNPFVTSGTCMSHLQIVFASSLV